MRLIASLIGTTILMSAGAAAAQTSAIEPADASVTGQSDDQPRDSMEIIVTAQRRDERLSKTPVAVTVLTNDALAKANIVSEQELRSAAPGLSIRAGINSNQLNYSLRGQSQDPYSGTRPGVLPYINEVQIGGNGGSSAFYDLASVQVLKGPQGTLFGRSATGGAILFTTATPSDEVEGYFSALGGTYRAFKVEGAFNTPIDSEGNVLARIAFIHQSREGFQRNLYNDQRFGANNNTGVRGSLTFKVGPNFKNDLVVDYYHSDSENTAAVINGLEPLAAPGSAPYVPSEILYGGIATPEARAAGIAAIQAFLAGAPPAALAAVPAFYDAYFSDPRRPSGGLRAALNAQLARGPFIADFDGPNFYKGDNLVVTNRSSLELGPNLTLRNILGFTYLRQNTPTDADGTPFGVGKTPNDGKVLDTVQQFSEEFQLQGQVLDEKLDFVVGGYYSKESDVRFQNSQFFEILLGGPPVQNNFATIRNDTIAGYGQGTFHVTSKLGVTIGLRYTSEKVSKETLPGDTFRTALTETPPPGYSYFKQATYNRLSWQGGLQYQATPSLLFYAQSRRAYKSGGFNSTVSPFDGGAAQGGDGFDAERVTDLEIGTKFSGLVGTIPLRMSLDYYHNWLVNSQRVAYTVLSGGPGNVTVNVPSGKTDGVEFEGSLQPTRWLTIGGSANYTNAEFGSAPGFVGLSFSPTAPIVPAPLVYDQVPDTPKYSGSAYASITVPVTDGINALLHADYYAQSKVFISSRSVNNIGTIFTGYSLVGLRAGIENPAAGWSLIGNIKNLTNKVYFVGGVPTGDVYQVNVAVPGAPRTFTLEARFKF